MSTLKTTKEKMLSRVTSAKKSIAQNSDTSQQAYSKVQRESPTWQPQHSSIFLEYQAAGGDQIEIPHRAAGQTAMERWLMESQRQGPWNNISSIENRRYEVDYKRVARDFSQANATDSGSWRR